VAIWHTFGTVPAPWRLRLRNCPLWRAIPFTTASFCACYPSCAPHWGFLRCPSFWLLQFAREREARPLRAAAAPLLVAPEPWVRHPRGAQRDRVPPLPGHGAGLVHQYSVRAEKKKKNLTPGPQQGRGNLHSLDMGRDSSMGAQCEATIRTPQKQY